MAGRLRRALIQIATGYGRSLRRIVWSLILIAGSVVVSAAIVFPLWYFSTHDRRAYTIVVLIAAALALLFLLFRKTRAFWGLPAKERTRRFRRGIVRFFVVVAYIVGLYIVFGFYVVGLIAAAVPLTVVYLAALGYTLYVRRTRKTT